MKKKDVFIGEVFQGLGIVQGWREIGRYIGRSGRSARRWYDNYHLPIHYSGSGRPFAFIFEIDGFMNEWSRLIVKECKDQRERNKEHCAMMRSCRRQNNEKKQQTGSRSS